MDEESRLLWLAGMAQSARGACVLKSVQGGPSIHDSLAAIIGGAVNGALTQMSRRDVYEVVQRVADNLALTMIDSERHGLAGRGGAR
jgi:hypothetical protein